MSALQRVESPLRVRLATFAVIAVVLAVVTFVIEQSGGGTTGVRVAALLMLEIFSVVGGILLYVCWRLRRRPDHGWLSALLLTMGFAEIPFLLLSLADASAMTAIGAEFSELVAAGSALVFTVLAWRGAPLGRVGPLTIGLGVAGLIGLVRVTQPRWLPLPDGWEDGTAWQARVLVYLIAGCTVVLLFRLPSPWYVRGCFIAAIVVLGGLAGGDDRYTETVGAAPALASLAFALFLGQEYLSASMRLLIDTLRLRLDELADLAVREAAADRVAQRDGAVLDEIRSTLGPLAEASRGLEAIDVDTPQRAAFSAAVNREIARANEMLRRP